MVTVSLEAGSTKADVTTGLASGDEIAFASVVTGGAAVVTAAVVVNLVDATVDKDAAATAVAADVVIAAAVAVDAVAVITDVTAVVSVFLSPSFCTSFLPSNIPDFATKKPSSVLGEGDGDETILDTVVTFVGQGCDGGRVREAIDNVKGEGRWPALWFDTESGTL